MDKLAELREAYAKYKKALSDLFASVKEIEQKARPVMDEIVQCYPIILEHYEQEIIDLDLGEIGTFPVEVSIEWQDPEIESRRLCVSYGKVNDKTMLFFPFDGDAFEYDAAESGCKYEMEELVIFAACADQIIDRLKEKLTAYCADLQAKLVTNA